MSKRLQVIINPASGDGDPETDLLERIFRASNASWSLSVTQEIDDVQRIARQAVEEDVDVVVAYGGDGTVNEVAHTLVGTDIPLGILPGGTGNVVARELGIPQDVEEAARLIVAADSHVDAIDMGQVGDHVFLLRAGFGFEAGVMVDTKRQQKNQFGLLAYLWNGVTNLSDPEIAQYRFRVDGEEIGASGFVAAVVNAGNLGMAGLHLGQPLSPRDGLLDLMVIEEPNWQLLLGALGKALGDGEVPLDDRDAGEPLGFSDLREIILHWQGAVIEVEAEPRQNVHYDGEILDNPSWPLKCEVLPKALKVVVPRRGADAK